MPVPKEAQTPNILLMMVDQMRFDAMGCAGNPHVQTPNLDRLAREGVRFTRAYTPAPVCMPARYGMLTGQYISGHGRPDLVILQEEPQLPTLPQQLGQSGYVTHAVGKMHFRPVRHHYGFHRMELMEEIPDYREDDEYLLYLKANGYGHVREVHGVRNMLYHMPQVSVIPEEHHGSTWVGDQTVDFLRRIRNRPFFCFSSWIAPHPPWNPPEPFASMYDLDSLPLPVGWERDPATLPPRLRPYQRFADVRDASPEMLRRIKALYYGSVSLVDKAVGKILDALDEFGLSENTLVIFTSDHGEMLGDQHMFQKGNPFDASARIPLLLRPPRTYRAQGESGRTCDDLVTLLDVMPTALHVAERTYGGERPLPGASLLGRPGGGLAVPRSQQVIELGEGAARWLSLIEGDYKYNYYVNGGWEELYNLSADPNEDQNLLLPNTAGTPSPADGQRAARMKAALTRWEAAHGLPSTLTPAGELRTTPAKDDAQTLYNTQFPRWVPRLPAAELAEMEPPGDAVRNAIRHERTFTLEDLRRSGSLEYWLRTGGSLE